MIVKKADILNELCETLQDIDKDEIERAYNFFWREGVYKSLHDLVYPRIHIKNIGTFSFIQSKIPRLKTYLERETEDYVENPFLLERINFFEDEFKKEHEKRNEKRRLRNEINENLEKKVENS